MSEQAEQTVNDRTDLDMFIAVLESAGHQYAVETVHEICWNLGGTVKSVEGDFTLVTVYGHFYDELYAEFDASGQMIEMSSHVVIGSPESKRAKLIVEGGE